ncbi:MAG: hypothetical protein WC606_05430 [Candidatus Absconditabacterales bacterium]
MAKTKNSITRGLIFVVGMLGCVRGAKVTFQPGYSDVRFQPADQFHAGCTNSADILFTPQGQNVSKFTLVLYYNPENIEILRILPNTTHGIASSKIEYDKIILEVQNPTFTSTTEATSFFQLYFKSDIVGKETLTLGTGSEAITANKTYPLKETFDLNFAKVPECEPDIILPSINLIYPKDTSQRITLDQYFVFDIKDIGKGIDKNSVVINFNGDQYFYGSENLKRNGNYLTFYPKDWLSINTSIDLKISVADQQSYGGANQTESIYNFKTATGMLLNKNINPMMFRKIVQEADKISASSDECKLLIKLGSEPGISYQNALTSIIQKLGCDTNTIDTAVTSPSEKQALAMNTSQQQYRNISVFATIGWILFFIAFTLKIHYLLAYRKHKKISEKLKMKN